MHFAHCEESQVRMWPCVGIGVATSGSCQELCVVTVFPSVPVAVEAIVSREQILPFLILFSEQDLCVPLCSGVQTKFVILKKSPGYSGLLSFDLYYRVSELMGWISFL